MNVIRAKIIFFWLLLAAFAVLLYSGFPLFAWCAYLPLLFIRHSRPKLSQPSQRLGYLVSFVIIGFLILVLIHGFSPFPASLVTVGKILGLLIIVPLLIHTVHSDYRMFRAAL